MTTATVSRDSGVAVLVGAGAATAVLGAVLALVGGLVDGSPAAYGAIVGTLLAITVFGLGAAAVNLVAGVLPTMSLVVAMMTYILQLVVIWLVLSALESTELLESTLARGWLGGAVIIGAMAWMAGQVGLHITRRVPAFDLPEPTMPDQGLENSDGGKQ
ncbi:hypothetical protein GCM10027020_19530 [Nocardioides salsibiostraticola]